MRYAILLSFLTLCATSVLAESAAGVRLVPPAGWTNEGARPMRAATYREPAEIRGDDPSSQTNSAAGW